MQCVSCHFENLPGSPVCGRCGTSLGLGSSAIDIHPPRASRWDKRWRGLLSVARTRPEPGQVEAGADRSGQRLLGSVDPARSIVLRLIVPGWAQRRLGQRLRGRLFFYSWLALLAGSALWWGTTLGSVVLGLAFSIHTAAASDALSGIAEQKSRRSQLASAMVRAAILGVLVYGPAVWFVTRVALPNQVQQTYGPLATGDVVLVNQWAFWRSPPRAGELVLYSTPVLRIPVGDHAVQQFGGQRIDRVLAVAGDHVVQRDGRLRVNGQESGWLPLNAAAMPPALNVQVPAGQCLIVPSSDQIAAQTPLLTSLDQVTGRVYWRHAPLKRMGLVR